jgi:hypothetical protein
MLQWALLGIFIAFLIFAYIIIQGTRAAMAWRQAATSGDVKVIRDIVEDAISVWRSARRPKEAPPDVWRGVQSMQLVDAAPGFVRVSCQAQSNYRMVDGVWVEISNPLQEGFGIAAKVAEMLFYELPHYRPDRAQIDIYTSFREGDGLTQHVCILSLEADRDLVKQVDWEEWSGEEIVDHLGARYRLGERGQPLPIEVEPPAAPDDSEAAEEETAKA